MDKHKKTNHAIVVLLFSLMLFPVVLSGQRTISGRITDAADGEPIPAVAVFLATTTIGTTTDLEGNYRLIIPGEGSYRLAISHVGYQPVFRDIEPGNTALVANIALEYNVIDEVAINARIRFRQKDINLFWKTILGRLPSKKTIYALNPETVYYYYNSATNSLKVTCREPLQIVNNETGYLIQFVLDEFTHNYNTEISAWKYEYLFSELKPVNDKQKTTWEENRKKVYRVSLVNFIKSLYNNTLKENGYLLTYLERKDETYNTRNTFETVRNVNINPGRTAANNFRTTIDSLETFLSTDAVSGVKTLYIPADLKDYLMLICFGNPITPTNINEVDQAQAGRLNWLRVGYALNILQTPGGPVNIFPDGTCSNQLMLAPYMSSNSLLGLDLKLPYDYTPDAVSNELPILAKTNDFITENEMTERFEQQPALYPQEKIHLHTDRDIYVPGEKIWFKAYVADAQSNMYPTKSEYVYVELISPADTLVGRVMSGLIDDMFYGYLPVTEKIPAGDYTLRAYTRYAENLGDDYFFKKNIRIGNSPPPTLPQREGVNDIAERSAGLGDLLLPPPKGDNRDNPRITGNLTNLTNLANPINPINPINHSYDFDVSFFPEGGNLLEGVFCKVAFKALNSQGDPEHITGKLIDENGVEIDNVKTFYAGMGVLGYVPETGKRVYLKCSNGDGVEKQFELPQPATQAYSLTALSMNDRRLLITVRQSAHAPDIPLYILAHSQGQVLYFAEWDKGQEFITMMEEALPAGVIQFVLFDEQMNPLSERLVFSKNQMSETIAFDTDQEVYAIREKVVATLSLGDIAPSLLERVGEGIPLENAGDAPTHLENADLPLSHLESAADAPSHLESAGVRSHFSVAITDDRDVHIDESVTILSSLLLSSEIKGYIENPAYYLQDTKESATALDYLMMTHGWRRYNVAEVAKARYENPRIPFQVDRRISGQVRNPLTGRPVAEANVTLALDGDIRETSTDRNGLFAFEELDFPDGANILLQALSSAGSDNVRLTIDDEQFPGLVYAPQNHLPAPAPVKQEENIVTPEGNAVGSDDVFSQKAEQRARFDDEMRVINLDEVMVNASRIRRNESRIRYWSNLNSDITIRRDQIEIQKFRWLAEYVAAFVPGVQIVRSSRGNAPSIVFLRNIVALSDAYKPPVLYIDGFPVGATNDPNAGFDLPPEEIESIDIFKDGAGFGMRGAFGVISITTRKGFTGNRLGKLNYAIYAPLGYQQPAEFYAPKYETQQSRQSPTPDYRTTIFWKPDIVISAENDKAIFEFYTSDFSTTYSVVIEGITDDGRIVRQVEKIKVE